MVGIVRSAVESPSEVARLFGLRDSPGNFFEVSKENAKAVLVSTLAHDMAYNCSLMPLADAAALAEEFIASFREDARYFTNRDPDTPPSYRSWNPVTDFTFDTGILVLSHGVVGCAWFMDED